MPRILFDDDHLILVEKPSGLLSQADASGNDNVQKRLESQGFETKPVHRLDRATGGVMVYALTDKCAAALSTVVQDHTQFVKEYLAVVHGAPTEPCGDLEDLLFHDVCKNKSYVVKRKRGGVKHAKLSYRVVETVTKDDQTYSLICVRLHTGRTHQIRVQFASRHLPLVGDSRYGGSRDCPLALWSHRLSFSHPVSGEPISATSLPDLSAFPWNMFDKEVYK